MKIVIKDPTQLAEALALRAKLDFHANVKAAVEAKARKKQPIHVDEATQISPETFKKLSDRTPRKGVFIGQAPIKEIARRLGAKPPRT